MRLQQEQTRPGRPKKKKEQNIAADHIAAQLHPMAASWLEFAATVEGFPATENYQIKFPVATYSRESPDNMVLKEKLSQLHLQNSKPVS